MLGRTWLVITVLVITALAMTVLAGCTQRTASPQPTAAVAPHVQSATELLRVQVLATLQHDATMYTQGLEIREGTLYEGSGLVGQSRLRATALADGATPREASLPAPLFGEGLTVAGDRLWQLTWTNGIAIERDPATLVQRRQVPYQGEGWGLCYDGNRLVMSNGSDRLTFRDPVTFAPSGHVDVRLEGKSVSQLNELECAGGVVWANVYQTDRILRINPSSGAVTGVVDASGLYATASSDDVLNGIAAIPDTDEFLITGKRWPSLFRVRFIPVHQ